MKSVLKWLRVKIPLVSKKAIHCVFVTIRLRHDDASKSIRAGTLAVVVVALFVTFSVWGGSSFLQMLMNSPFNLDLALRTMSTGWFEPRNTIPVTLVYIDEQTHRSWRTPAVTPREPLKQLLDVVTKAGPMAVVVDIDMSWGDAHDEAQLLAFLERYDRPAPLIFPKRVEVGADGTRRAAHSAMDAVVVRNSRLAWAHASFETTDGGVFRHWTDWLAVCDESGTAWLPSVPVRLTSMLSALPPGLTRPAPPASGSACRRDSDPPSRLLLIGPRMTGVNNTIAVTDPRWVSARILLDPTIDREDGRLFTDRVVLIGANHASSGDFWLTPSGVLPGVELLANTVRYAPILLGSGLEVDFAFRIAALCLFGLLVAAAALPCGLCGFVAALMGVFMFVAIAIGKWDYYRVFDALEVAILMTVFYKGLQAILNLIDDIINVGLLRACLRQSVAAKKPEGKEV